MIDISKYFQGRPCKRGHCGIRRLDNGDCVECLALRGKNRNKEQRSSYNAQYHDANRELINLRQKLRARETYSERQEYIKQKRIDSPETIAKWNEARKASQSEWRAANPHIIRAASAKRRAAEILRTPKWADLKAIIEFYRNCPDGHHVDHIIPLQAKLASGLHVLNNLQYLPASINCSKKNSFNIE